MEVLKLSLAEILAKFESGFFTDLRARDLRHWILALFADSAVREKTLRAIERASSESPSGQ